VLGTDPQDLKYKGEPSTLEIGDRTIIREFATLNRGTSASGRTVVGSDCLLMAYTHVAHDCIVGDFVTLAPRVSVNGRIKIEDGVYIGSDATFLPGKADRFLTVGEGAVVGAGAVVTRDVEPHTTVVGAPAKPRGARPTSG